MSEEDTAKRIYDEAIVIDALNVSNWESPDVYQSLHTGRITAINATSAVWENYPQAMDNIAAWLRRFREYNEYFDSCQDRRRHPSSQAGGKGGDHTWVAECLPY